MYKIQYSKPFFTNHDSKRVLKYVSDLKNNWFGEFRETRNLQENLSKKSNTKYVHCMSSGTSALICSFLALGIKRGDEVLMTAYTHIATVNTAKFLGTKIKLIDIEKNTTGMDYKFLRKQATSKTKCIVMAAINGRLSDSIKKIISFAKNKKIPILMDGASALCSKKYGKQILSMGDISITSFSTSKLISSGQGGAIFTNRKDLNDKIIPLKNFGRLKSTDEKFNLFGLNFKLSDALSVLANSQLDQIEFIAEKKAKVFKRYIANLGSENFCKINFNEVKNTYVDLIGCKNVSNRDKLMTELEDNQIETRIMFPSVNDHGLHKDLKGQSKIADEMTRKGVLLPSGVELKMKEIDFICKVCEKYL